MKGVARVWGECCAYQYLPLPCASVPLKSAARIRQNSIFSNRKCYFVQENECFQENTFTLLLLTSSAKTPSEHYATCQIHSESKFDKCTHHMDESAKFSPWVDLMQLSSAETPSEFSPTSQYG